MKKILLTGLLSTGLILSSVGSCLTGAQSVFADTPAPTPENAPAVKEHFTPELLPKINLNLEEAYKKMEKDSPQAIMVNFNFDNEKAVGLGYTENLSNIRKAERKAASDPSFSMWAPDTSSKLTLELSRDFAKVQAPKNYEAGMNALKMQTYEMYYKHKYIEAQLKAAKDNLDRNNQLYKNTQLRLQVGKASKLDMLNAENNLNEAKDGYNAALNGYEQFKMQFNLFMGYNIHQPVNLTESLVPLDFPTQTVDAAIKSALEKRNEIYEAEYKSKLAQVNLDNYKAYPHNSAKYKKAKLGVDMAAEAIKRTPSKIEIEVRTKYMDMKQKYDLVQTGKKSYDNAREAARLGELQFKTGFSTITDSAGLNLAAFNMEQNYYKAILDYNMAVQAYNLCSGVGLEPAAI